MVNWNPKDLKGVVWKKPLPFLQEDRVTRWLCRGLTAWAGRLILNIEGVEHITPDKDPFVLTANHNHRLEAVLFPSLLAYLREGKLIGFLSDWHWMVVPLIGNVFRRSQAIPILEKSARLKWMNRFKKKLDTGQRPDDLAIQRLRSGHSIGIFPEGRMNRDPGHLLRGYRGAALIAMQARTPIVPVGIRFPFVNPQGKIGDTAKMTITIGQAFSPHAGFDSADQLHHHIMEQIATLSGKRWSPEARKR